MERESQNIEFKEAWQDDYLAWICGFANADGGVIQIGRADNGTLKGLSKAESKRLMDLLPNKISTTLGLTPNIALLTEDSKDYIVITIAPSTYHPIAFKGKYYKRVGANNLLLTSPALTSFLLERTGQSFDSLPASHVQVEALSSKTLEAFRQEAINKTGNPGSFAVSNDDLLEKLGLLNPNGQLNNAAVLAFHPVPKKVIPGAYIQIGLFGEDIRPLFDDDIVGNTLEQVERVIDLLNTKYLLTPMTWSGIKRVEKMPIPTDALREAIVNAIIHRDYAVSTPIHIHVGMGYLKINNPGGLYGGLTVDQLRQRPASRQRNPILAEVFRRAGYFEAWGTGIATIIRTCETHGDVTFSFYDSPAGFEVDFRFVYQAKLDHVDGYPDLDLPEVTQPTALTSKEPVKTSKETGLTSRETLSKRGLTSKEIVKTSKETGLTSRETPTKGGITSKEIVKTSEETGLTSKETPTQGGGTSKEPTKTSKETGPTSKETPTKGGITSKETAKTSEETGLTSRETPTKGGITSKEIVKTSKETGLTSKETPAKGGSTSKETVKTSKETTLPIKEQILEALKQNPNLKVKDMAIMLGLTDQGVRYHLDILKAEGRVVREGATKKPSWRVVV